MCIYLETPKFAARVGTSVNPDVKLDQQQQQLQWYINEGCRPTIVEVVSV